MCPSPDAVPVLSQVSICLVLIIITGATLHFANTDADAAWGKLLALIVDSSPQYKGVGPCLLGLVGGFNACNYAYAVAAVGILLTVATFMHHVSDRIDPWVQNGKQRLLLGAAAAARSTASEAEPAPCVLPAHVAVTLYTTEPPTSSSCPYPPTHLAPSTPPTHAPNSRCTPPPPPPPKHPQESYFSEEPVLGLLSAKAYTAAFGIIWFVAAGVGLGVLNDPGFGGGSACAACSMARPDLRAAIWQLCFAQAGLCLLLLGFFALEHKLGASAPPLLAAMQGRLFTYGSRGMSYRSQSNADPTAVEAANAAALAAAAHNQKSYAKTRFGPQQGEQQQQQQQGGPAGILAKAEAASTQHFDADSGTPRIGTSMLEMQSSFTPPAAAGAAAEAAQAAERPEPVAALAASPEPAPPAADATQ